MLIRLENVGKTYREGSIAFEALSNVDLVIKEGESVAIMGASGSGKSTLLNILGAMDKASEGKYYLQGEEISSYSEKQMAHIRNEIFGFVMQDFALIERETVEKNVILPLLYSKRFHHQKKARVEQILKEVGLFEKRHQPVTKLSGGQRQRVAIARAMVNDASVLLCDEPTGSVQLVQHYQKTTPVIFWSLSILISLMTERQRVRFSSRVKVSYIFLKSFCNSFSTAAKSGGASCVVSGIWFNAAVYIS